MVIVERLIRATRRGVKVDVMARHTADQRGTPLVSRTTAPVDCILTGLTSARSNQGLRSACPNKAALTRAAVASASRPG